MSSITEDLKQTFGLATLRQRAKSLTRPADWEKANEITMRYAFEANKQGKLYKHDYKIRVEKALQVRIDKAGVKDRTLKHRLFGSDNFDKSALTRQAHRDVQHDHSRRMSQLEARETQELDVLVSTAEQRDATKQELRAKTRDDFQRATDRRAGPERRR
ncbi:MAG: hypothetical protein L3J30_12665 [Marinosulfonomonas sp.]|nr:hypothetical protein [Marinosulfonomonas sp.]